MDSVLGVVMRIPTANLAAVKDIRSFWQSNYLFCVNIQATTNKQLQTDEEWLHHDWSRGWWSYPQRSSMLFSRWYAKNSGALQVKERRLACPNSQAFKRAFPNVRCRAKLTSVEHLQMETAPTKSFPPAETITTLTYLVMSDYILDHPKRIDEMRNKES